MIKANELRIENILTWDGKICKVIGVSRLMFKVITLDGKRPDQDEYKDIKPIPLSPEWLERCGFTIKHEATEEEPLTYYALKLDLDLAKEEDGYYLRYECQDSYYDSNIGTRIEYVHHLQNAYFALTGEELQIKMP